MKILKDINFMPQFVIKKEEASKKRVTIISFVLVYTFLAATLFIAPVQSVNYYKEQVNKINSELSQLEDVNSKVKELELLTDFKKRKMDILNFSGNRKIGVTEFIKKLSDGIPPGVKISAYVINGKDASITFQTNSTLELIQLIDKLNGLNMFNNVSIDTYPLSDTSYSINLKLKIK